MKGSKSKVQGLEVEIWKITLFGMGKIASVILTKDSLMTDKVVVNVQKIHLSLILLRAAKAVMKERLPIYLF